jgi:hypothetical protein
MRAASAVPPKIAKVLAASTSGVRKSPSVKKTKPAANPVVTSSSKGNIPDVQTNKATAAAAKPSASTSRVSKPSIPSPRILASGSAATSTTAANQKVSSTDLGLGLSLSRRATQPDLKSHPVSVPPAASHPPITVKRESQTKSPVAFTPKIDGPPPDTTASQDPRRRPHSHGLGQDPQGSLQLNTDYLIKSGMGTDMNIMTNVNGEVMLQQPPVMHIPNGVPLTEAQIQSLLARLPSQADLDVGVSQSPPPPPLPSSGTANNFPIGILSPIAQDVRNGNQGQCMDEIWPKNSVLANGTQIHQSPIPAVPSTPAGEMAAQAQNALPSSTLNLLMQFPSPTTVMEQGPTISPLTSASGLPVSSVPIPTLNPLPVKLEPNVDMASTSKMDDLISNNNNQLERLNLRASTSFPTSPTVQSQSPPSGNLQGHQGEPLSRSSSSHSPHVPPRRLAITSPREPTLPRRTSTSSASSPPPASAASTTSFKDDKTAAKRPYGMTGQHDDVGYRNDRDRERKWGQDWGRERDRSWARDRDWRDDDYRDWRDDDYNERPGEWRGNERDRHRRRRSWERRY